MRGHSTVRDHGEMDSHWCEGAGGGGAHRRAQRHQQDENMS